MKSQATPDQPIRVRSSPGVHTAGDVFKITWFDGFVFSCFPLVELQIYPTELEMQLSNSICTWYSLHKIIKCNLK